MLASSNADVKAGATETQQLRVMAPPNVRLARVLCRTNALAEPGAPASANRIHGRGSRTAGPDGLFVPGFADGGVRMGVTLCCFVQRGAGQAQDLEIRFWKLSLALAELPRGMDRPRLSLSMSSPVPPSTPGNRLPLWGSEHGSLRGLAQYSERDMDGLPSPAGSRDWDLFAPAHWEHRSDRSDGSSVAPPLSSGSSGEGSVPTRSKTKSFFDADSAVLSPPPNPLSRNGSLRTPGVAQGPCSEFGSSHAPSWLERTDDPQRPPIIDRTLSDSPVHSPVDAAPPLPVPSKSTRLPPLPSVSTSQLASPPLGPLSSLPTPVEPPLSRGARFRNFGRKVVGATSTSAAIAAAAPQPSGPPPILSPAESETSPVERLPGGLVANDTDPDQGPKPGEVVGAYRIVRILGKGAFSRVALASRKGKEREVDPTGPPDELVALKMIARRSYEGNERMRISVVREVEVLKVSCDCLPPN